MSNVQTLVGKWNDPPQVAPWLASVVVMAWTAFETLAGDLWADAVNIRPSRLAHLAGNRNRIEQLTRKRPKQKGESSAATQPATGGKQADGVVLRLSDIDKITRGTFNMSQCVGSVLRRRINFTRLEDIREAYSRAFRAEDSASSTDGIDAALASQSLDALSAVRNLIVHRAGVADATYLEDMLKSPTTPRLQLKQELQLSGEIVRGLIDPVATCCVDLVQATDGWLVRTGAQDGTASPGK